MEQQGREAEFLASVGRTGGTGKKEVRLRVTASAFKYISDRDVAIFLSYHILSEPCFYLLAFGWSLGCEETSPPYDRRSSVLCGQEKDLLSASSIVTHG